MHFQQNFKLDRGIWIKIMCKTLLFSLMVIGLFSAGLLEASPHTHQHKERTEDGAFSPRDAGHFDGEDHHTEFDHEAILGRGRRYFQTFTKNA